MSYTLLINYYRIAPCPLRFVPNKLKKQILKSWPHYLIVSNGSSIKLMKLRSGKVDGQALCKGATVNFILEPIQYTVHWYH